MGVKVLKQFRKEVGHKTVNETDDTSQMIISISTKNCDEKYFMPYNFTGQVFDPQNFLHSNPSDKGQSFLSIMAKIPQNL
jgi:hypothetical protein